MAKGDAPRQPPVRRVTGIDGHRPGLPTDGFIGLGHQPTGPIIQTRGHQPVVPVGQPVAQGPSAQGGGQATNGGTVAQVPSSPPNQGTSGKK